MLNLRSQLEQTLAHVIYKLWQIECKPILQNTRPEFIGEFTWVAFPLAKQIKLAPELICNQVGAAAMESSSLIERFEVVKGFLNFKLKSNAWIQFFTAFKSLGSPVYKPAQSSGQHLMVEYSSPNTNKPLHLGHIRNNVLGYAVSELMMARGHKVTRVNLVNDRGIHICKSMVAWMHFGKGETPESTGLKGDHLVGKYYVRFDKEYRRQVQNLIESGIETAKAEQEAPLMLECQELLRKWELQDPETRNLWSTMNGWVYKGFETTYGHLGIRFDHTYYESETYTLGKTIIEEGLKKGVFYKKENGSVAIDLSNEGLDEKIVLRADGTSVYITQDIGTAIERFVLYPDLSRLIYTVGNEQDYHFKVLFKILARLGYSWANQCKHLSYGMVELPEGKMKSREGNVVDADDLITEMIQTAQITTDSLGKTEQFSKAEAEALYHMLGMGALKYYILKVDAGKTMLFDPRESIDFNGHTGPFIQYTHARIQSLLKKTAGSGENLNTNLTLEPSELELMRWFHDLETVLQESELELNPAKLAQFAYDLTKCFNRFYQECPVLREENKSVQDLRIALSAQTALILRELMQILGIEMPHRM